MAKAIRALLYETMWNWEREEPRRLISPKHYVCYARRVLHRDRPGQHVWYDGMVVGKRRHQYAVLVIPERDEIVVQSDWTGGPGALLVVPITEREFDLFIARTIDQWLTNSRHYVPPSTRPIPPTTGPASP